MIIDGICSTTAKSKLKGYKDKIRDANKIKSEKYTEYVMKKNLEIL
ncbi:MAG: hypothetical protein K2M50_09545 [Treponemataceae bacterium]|nr:hypothetical protein [Treponemataceae bacterium]